MTDENSNNKFGSFFEIEQIPNSRGLLEFVRWIDEGSIELSPDFQREYVWHKQKASLLIESFLRNIPVPSIFMYINEDNKRCVIDGKQRLETIRRFVKGVWDESKSEIFALDFPDHKEDLNPRQGKTYETLDEEDKKRFNDAYLNAITIRTPNTNKDKDAISIYYIFERLNTGGVTLTPSEIRLAIWNKSELLKSIKDLSNTDIWKKSIKISPKKEKENKSYPDHERAESLLKIISLSHSLTEYKAPMKDFLTSFLRKVDKEQIDFTAQIEALQSIMKDEAIQEFLKQYLGKKNIIVETVYTAVLIAKNKNITYTMSAEDVSIFEDDAFTKQGGTAQGGVVKRRIKKVYDVITGQELEL
ncbi:DUF262 domain-containing protein [Candidatus Deianiraea vastatrix]|nr:DUF262 domain-containing protein [Candidatus Deianiraea vastatrix]